MTKCYVFIGDLYIPAYPLLPRIQNTTLNLLLNRILSPYFQKRIGIGTIASARKPRSELPQPRPSASYIDGPARGNKAPTKDRSTVFAAIAEVACIVKASIR